MVTMRVAKYLKHVGRLDGSVSYFKLTTFEVTNRSRKISALCEAVGKLAGTGLSGAGLAGAAKPGRLSRGAQ